MTINVNLNDICPNDQEALMQLLHMLIERLENCEARLLDTDKDIEDIKQQLKETNDMLKKRNLEIDELKVGGMLLSDNPDRNIERFSRCSLKIRNKSPIPDYCSFSFLQG